MRMFEPVRRLLVTAIALSATALPAALVAPTAQAQIPYSALRNTTEGKYAAVVVDANTGEVLFAKNADSQRYPASLTKIMTMYLTFEALASGRLKATDTLVVSPRAAAQAPTKLGLRAGESITVDEAIRAVAVKSANDMAVALAEKIGGSEERFCALMTLRAQELGMTNTRYVNANGLPDSRQLTSARDLAILSRAVMRDYPQYYSYFGLHDFNYHGQSIRNHNGLLAKMPGVDGLKTGFTNASGFNLAASAVRGDRRLIAVVLGGNSVAARDSHVEDLLETGFDVIRRRQMGERITVAQNLFEPAPIGVIDRPATEEGSADQAGLRIVLTDNSNLRGPVANRPIANPPPPPPRPVAASVETARGKARGKGDWLVQVGAYRQKTQARSQLAAVSHKFSKHFANAQGGVQGGEGMYRVRFSGFTADEARAACAALGAKRQSCMVVPPSH